MDICMHFNILGLLIGSLLAGVSAADWILDLPHPNILGLRAGHHLRRLGDREVEITPVNVGTTGIWFFSSNPRHRRKERLHRGKNNLGNPRGKWCRWNGRTKGFVASVLGYVSFSPSIFWCWELVIVIWEINNNRLCCHWHIVAAKFQRNMSFSLFQKLT